MTDRHRFSTSLMTALVLLIILCSAAWLRVVQPWQQVFPTTGETRLLGTDAYYHLRHARFSLREFPKLQRLDPWTHYPDGQRANGIGLFDLGLAALALPAPAALETIAAWYPVGFGLAAYLALFFLIQTLAGRAAGLWAVFILLLYPGPFLTRSMLGFTDHHAAEVFLTVLTLLGVVRLLISGSGQDSTPWFRPAILVSLPLALFQFTWVGAPLHLVVLIAGFVLTAIMELWRSGCIAGLWQCYIRYALGLLLLTGPVGVLMPELIMDRGAYSLLLMAMLGLALGVTPFLIVLERAVQRYGHPRVAALIAVIIGAAALTAMLQVPVLSEAASVILKVKVAVVAEHHPFHWWSYFNMYGLPGGLALLSPFAALSIEQAPRRRATLIVIMVTFLLAALRIRTNDYDYLLGPLLAGLAALTLIKMCSVLTGLWRIVFGVLVAVVFVVTIFPFGWSRTPWASKAEIDRLLVYDQAWHEATQWMKHNTPAPDVSPGAQPAPGVYGVWSAWDYGSLIAAQAERPVIWSQGSAAHIAAWLLESNEERSTDRLCSRCRGAERIRYVVLDANTMGRAYIAHVETAGARLSDYVVKSRQVRQGERELILYKFGPRYEHSVAARLYLQDGAGLGGYRLVFASQQHSVLAYTIGLAGDDEGQLGLRLETVTLTTPSERERYAAFVKSDDVLVNRRLARVYYDGRILPTVKIFERVPGTRLSGRAPGAAVVEARLSLNSIGTGQKVNYVNRAMVRADGSYELVLPYAAGPGAVFRGTDYISRLPYIVQSLDAIGGAVVAQRRLNLREEQIQGGVVLPFHLNPEYSGASINDVD